MRVCLLLARGQSASSAELTIRRLVRDYPRTVATRRALEAMARITPFLPESVVLEMPDAPAEPDRLVSITRRMGRTTQNLLPDFLVNRLEVNLVQAGYPRGIDLPRILGIKITLSALAALLMLINGQPLLAAVLAQVPRGAARPPDGERGPLAGPLRGRPDRWPQTEWAHPIGW